MKSVSVTLVTCTHQRVAALRATLPEKLSIRGVDEVVVVVDGSTDGSIEYLESVSKSEQRLRWIGQERQGVQAARNAGIAAVRTDWILFLDDDDRVPVDYLEVLLAEAQEHDAAVVGAPWLNATRGRHDVLASEGRSTATSEGPTLRSSAGRFSTTSQFSPFLCSATLVKTDVAKQLLFDRGYRGNAWREETDFYLRAWTSGHRVVRTNRTYAYIDRRFPGGHSRDPIKYEYWVVLNELRFLRRHRGALRSIDPASKGVAREFGRSVLPRWALLVRAAGRRLGIKRAS